MKTNLGDVEKKLEQDGYKVKVEYSRYHGGEPFACTAKVFKEEQSFRSQPLAVGTAHCHPKDNFWKKKGRHMAVCRAAKEAGLL